MAVDVIILNRNLREQTDNLADSLEICPGVSSVVVVDAGSSKEQVSERTFIRVDDPETLRQGLRINRGFNFGLSTWIQASPSSEWVFLLPNDSVIISADFLGLEKSLNGASEIVAVVPVSEDNPYGKLIGPEGISLAWNVNEGPLLLRREFVEQRLRAGGEVFDNSNFRGYGSFLELSFQIYASNLALAVTNSIILREDTNYLMTLHELIGTEPPRENQTLLLGEGKEWFARKYGTSDKRALELATRLLFEEFQRVNPHLLIHPAV